jgi:hypothetical protein
VTHIQDAGHSLIFHSAQDPIYGIGIELSEYRNNIDIPLNLTTPFTVSGNNLLPPGFTYQGFVNFGNGSAVLAVSSVKLANLSSVPLPAGLPLLASGILVFGLMGKRRRISPHAG